MIGQRRTKVALAFVVGQNRRANGYSALMASFCAGHE
jgi:hypothetical protein